MHADKLYQQMMEHEAAIELAEKEGRPRPKFESILSNSGVSHTLASKSLPASTASQAPQPGTEAETDIWSLIKPDARREYEKKLAELPPEQQEYERMAVLGELKAQTGVAKKVEETFVEERIARMKRREAGQSTIGDTIKYWWGWG
jgi:DNA-directed RNA polymerase specialized sigma24 family protein